MVTCSDLALKLSQTIYDEDKLETEELEGLNLVDFYFLPHLNSKWFKKVRKANIEEAARKIDKPIYALDDQSAIVVIDNKIEVISEGKWFVINKPLSPS
jgi:dipeptidase E